MINFEVDEVVHELFQSLRSRYQGNLETSMKISGFIFDSSQMMYYKCHKVGFRRSGSYIDSPDSTKKGKAAINPKNENDKCFQYAVTAPLNYKEIKWNPERVSNVKPFITKYMSKGINYPSKIDDWKAFEKKNRTFALNIFYIKGKEIYPTYISKINLNCEKQIILLMVPNEGKDDMHDIAVKKLSTLLTGILSKHHGDFYCLSCLHSFRTESKLKFREKVFLWNCNANRKG